MRHYFFGIDDLTDDELHVFNMYFPAVFVHGKLMFCYEKPSLNQDDYTRDEEYVIFNHVCQITKIRPMSRIFQYCEVLRRDVIAFSQFNWNTVPTLPPKEIINAPPRMNYRLAE